MAAVVKSIRTDPRWVELVVKFRYNWVMAPIHLMGFEPVPHQLELLSAAQKTGCRVSVSSGHGTGKSSQIAIVVLIFMLMFPESRVILVANKLDQVKIAVLKNIKIYWRQMIKFHPWIEEYFVLTDTTFYERASKGIWELSPKAYKIGNEEALAGEHAKHMLWIIDEASGISDKAFGVITGSLTEANNRLVLLSQPTRDNGFFWQTHNDPSIMRDWMSLIFNSEDSPLVTDSFVMEKFRQYGNDRNSPEYMIKVRGLFPKDFKGYLLTSDDMLKATRAKPRLSKHEWGWVFTCDVGNGRDSSVININRVSGHGLDRRSVNVEVIEYSGSIDPVNFGREIVALVKTGNYPNVSVCIDADGVGSSTCQIVEEAGITVTRIRWGQPCFSDEDKLRFINKRAMAAVYTKDAIRSGRMRIDTNRKTRLQGARIPYLIDDKGRFVIEKKSVMREKLNIPSPDRFDTYCFIQLADVTPANAEVDIHTMEEREAHGGWAKEITQA
jgi:hypothetical protein